MTFTNASQSFKALNQHLDKNATTGRTGTRRGISNNHETTHRDSIQNPKCPEPGAALGGSDAGESQGATRPIVRITSHRLRLLDKDNLYRGTKALLDSLRYASLVHSDAENEIDYRAQQIKVSHRHDEKTVIDIDYDSSV